MKKLLALFIFLLGINFVSAEETCNSFYKVNLSIEGKGIVKSKLTDKIYSNDSTINVKCTDSFLFEVEAEEGYVIDGVYINGNHITADNYKVYGLYDINSTSNVKVTFTKTDKISDNETIFSSSESSISLYIPDLKENLKDDSILRVIIREITILFDKEFIASSKDSITIVASQVYKDDLSYRQQQAAKNSIYYNLNIYDGEKIVNSFKGKAKVVIPYSKSKDVYIYKADKNGKLTLIKSNYDKEKVTFEIKESGVYALSTEKLNEMGYIKSILNLNNQKVIALIGVGFAIALLILLLLIKKRK